MTFTPLFIINQSLMMPQKSLPYCSRCGVSMVHPIIEKDAGELIMRCVECNAINVLRLAIIDPMASLTLEVTGWKE